MENFFGSKFFLFYKTQRIQKKILNSKNKNNFQITQKKNGVLYVFKNRSQEPFLKTRTKQALK